MRRNSRGNRPVIRYSEAFKRQVILELERDGETYAELERKHGIRGRGTIKYWQGQYGNGTRGRIIRVEKPQETSEIARLKKQLKDTERALVKANVELSLSEAYFEIVCEDNGIQDVESYKKKLDQERLRKR